MAVLIVVQGSGVRGAYAESARWWDDTTDYYAVEDDYGTNEDFLELMEQAHARGIRMIVDLVLNHSSSKHPWHKIGERQDRANVASQEADDQSLLNLYRKLIRLRAEHPALGGGDFTPIQTDSASVYAYLRRAGGRVLLVVVNLGDGPVDSYGLSLSPRELSSIRGVEELLHGVEASVPERSPNAGSAAGSGRYQPIGVLQARTGYVLALESAGR